MTEMHVPHRVIRPQPQLLQQELATRHVSSAPLPTRHGLFTTHVFASAAHIAADPQGAPEPRVEEHVALTLGELSSKSNVLCRVHSECITSEVFGSLKCDCKEQLDGALAEIARRGSGVVLYLRQEGRGIGLANKIRAYDLQSSGHDTVDANRLLGLPDDVRAYGVARDMLKWLGVKSVRLMTNNPEKVARLRDLGVNVAMRVPLVIAPNPFSANYLETKRVRMAHELPRDPHSVAGHSGAHSGAHSGEGNEILPCAANGDAE